MDDRGQSLRDAILLGLVVALLLLTGFIIFASVEPASIGMTTTIFL